MLYNVLEKNVNIRIELHLFKIYRGITHIGLRRYSDTLACTMECLYSMSGVIVWATLFRYKNGVPLSQGKKYWISQDASGNCGLQLYDVAASDEGIYTCTLTNPAGEISANASLRIGSKSPIPLCYSPQQYS